MTPEPRQDAPDGFEWRVYVDPDFELERSGSFRFTGRRCRYTIGPGHRTCRKPAAAYLKRGQVGGGRWWAYCEDHLYGRWIEGDRVVGWRLKSITDPEGEWFVRRAT